MSFTTRLLAPGNKLILLLFLLLFITACGKKGALIYPDMLTPAAPSDVRADQFGSVVKLSFVLPQKDQAGRGLSNLAGVDVFKRSAPTGQPAGCSACTVDYALYKKIYLNLPDSRVIRKDNQLVLLDGDVRNERDYYYYIIPFTNDAVAGKPSMPVMATVAESPGSLRLKVIAEPTEIILRVTGMQPDKAGFAGYNLYRAVKGEAFTPFPHNKALIKGNSFTDIGLERGVTYVYAVRAVIKRGNNTFAESELSNQVEASLAED